MLNSVFRNPELGNELGVYRFLAAIGGLGMFVFGYLQHLANPLNNDPMVTRFIVGSLCFVALAITYQERIPKQYRYGVVEILFIIFTFQVFFANYNNNFAAPYMLTLMLTMMGITMSLRHLWKLRVYVGAFVVGLAITLFSNEELTQRYCLFVGITYLFAAVVTYLLQSIRINSLNQLEAGDELLRNILNETADAIFLADIKGFIIDSNERLLEMLMTTRENLTNKHINTILKEELSIEERKEIVRSANTAGIRRGEKLCIKMNGELFWGNFAIVVIKVRLKKLLLVRLTDVSKQKETELNLQLSEERYINAIAGTNDGIWDWNMVTNEVFFSERYKQMLGYADQEFANSFENWADNIFHEDRDRVIDNLNKYLNQLTSRYQVEFRMQHKQGYLVWILARGKVVRDENGKAIRMAGSHTDITQRKEAEELLQGILDSSLNGVMAYKSIRDKQGQIKDLEWVLINQSAAEMLNGVPETFMGKRLIEMSKPNQGEFFLKRYSDVVETGVPMNIEHFFEFRSGKKNWYHVIAVKLGDGVAVTFTDIEDRKRHEEELKAAKEAAEAGARAKAEFLATMSHEIRTPMNAVIGMTDLLKETPLTEVQLDYVETIHTSGDNLLSIINDILDYSKIDSGNLTIEDQPFDLVQSIEEVYGLLTPKAREKHLELLHYIAQDIPQKIIGDPIRIRQVLVNLINNAIKFTEKGEIFVAVTKQHTTGKQLQLLFEIKDTGIGIPKDKIDRLFQLFSQVDASTTRKYGGTGLGLAISKRLINLMGGEIWVTSQEGIGSTFSFTFVTSAAEDEFTDEVDSNNLLRDKRILLIDDNLTNLKILNLQCTGWGMTATTMNNPRKALDLLKTKSDFDLVILDMQMPEMDGLQLVREIRKLFSQQELPIIVLTSLGSLPNVEERNLISAFITKPAKQANLLYHIRRALSTSVSNEDEQPSKRIAVNQSTEVAARSDIKILVAEDNIINQKVALGSLKAMGYGADVASTGAEALEKLQQQHYDLILMDVQMPEMDGIEATMKIRQAYTDGNSPLIVAMTANAMNEDREKCLAAGMNDYVAKPVKLDTLKELMNKWFPAEQ